MCVYIGLIVILNVYFGKLYIILFFCIDVHGIKPLSRVCPWHRLSRCSNYSTNKSYTRKEKALKIYTGDDTPTMSTSAASSATGTARTTMEVAEVQSVDL